VAENQSPLLVQDNDTLKAFCQQVAAGGYITVDTEFMREKTYWPRLCLVQICAPGRRPAVIDPLADGLDLSPVDGLLHDPDLVKVVHAGRQDLEIFFRRSGRLPAPLFDTQVAAMILGHGEQLSYDALAARLLGRRLDKSARFTDWARRPLGQTQIAYAAGDVTHLCDLYERLREELRETGRTAWFTEEMNRLTRPETFANEAGDSWKRLKPRSDDRRFLGILKAVAAWREETARTRDIPRGWVLRDEALMDLAGSKPKTPDALAGIRGVSAGLAGGAAGRDLLAVIAAAQPLPDSALPAKPARKRASEEETAVAALLKVLLKQQCARHRVAARLVADSADIEKLAGGDVDVPAMKGWRFDMFGKHVAALKDGRLALAIREGKITVIEMSPAEAREG